MSVNQERTLKRLLPKGALPDDGRPHLSTARKRGQEEIVNTWAGERLWLKVQLLWDLHPVMEWLNYHRFANFDQAQAPNGALLLGYLSQEII